MKRFLVAAITTALAIQVTVSPAGAAPKCQKAAAIAVELITGDYDFTLAQPKQIKAPPSEVHDVR